MKPNTISDFAALVGIDWADAKHDICLQPAPGGLREFRVLPHDSVAIAEWAQALHGRFPGRIAVCLELAKGPLVYALQKYDFLVLFPINPSTLAKYREAFTPSRAKDDPTDAELALDFLACHPERLQPLQPQSAAMRTLDALVRERRQLVDDQGRLTNRLCVALKQYFPQVLAWFPSLDTLLCCAFLTRYSTLKQAQCARRTTLTKFFHEHHLRNPALIATRLAAIKAAQPLTEDPAVVLPNKLLVLALVDELRASLAAIARFDAAIAELAPTLPDYPLFHHLPGAGPVMAPRLLVAFGEDRSRYPDAACLQRYTGIAPVLERSGKQSWVHWRWQCPTFLRQTFVEWAGQTIPHSFWAAAFYRQQRAKGASHHATLRALAFKWLRILHRCWQTRTPYDEAKYLNALQRRGSPLLKTTAPSA